MTILDSPQQLTREELAECYTELVKLAKTEIVVIAGEFLALEISELMDSLIEQLKQGISMKIYIYDPIPERKKIDKLISRGAEVFLTQNYSRAHYFVVDGKNFSYHSHKRYDDTLLKNEEVTEEARNEFNRQLNDAKRNSEPIYDSLDSAEGVRFQREMNKKTNKIKELKGDLKKLHDIEDDISTPKQIDYIYNLEMVLGCIILVSAIIFHNAFGLVAIPIIILGLGIFLTSLMSKSRINKMRRKCDH